MLAREELATIDDFRFTRRMPSRARGVRELLRRGLTADGVEPPKTEKFSGSKEQISSPQKMGWSRRIAPTK